MVETLPTIGEGFGLALIAHFAGLLLGAMFKGFNLVADAN